MTVLRANNNIHAFPRRQRLFREADRRGGFSAPVSPQLHCWAKGLESRSRCRRHVIAEKKTPMRAFSTEGIRWDVLVITLGLALILGISVLAVDLDALWSGGKRIGRLNAGIASLESSNSRLREEISWAQGYMFPSANVSSGEPVRTVVLSPEP